MRCWRCCCRENDCAVAKQAESLEKVLGTSLMSDEILPIPTIPSGLAEASRMGTLIPFVGAGASRLAGCPDWNGFADAALRFFVDKGKFTHGQLAQISHLNPRVKLAIAKGLQEEHQTLIDYKGLLYPNGYKKDPKGLRLFGSLSALGKTFVTTNYDEWLDEELVAPLLSPGTEPDPTKITVGQKRKSVHQVGEFTADTLHQENTVIHLHGSLLDPDGMVLTTQDYVRHYANDRLAHGQEKENRVLTFLEYLFNRKTVLFVGYGLEELEILEYVILKARHKPGTTVKESKHYLLQGFFSHEHDLMMSLKRYYLEECGIQLIPFLRDQKDWDQLLDVMDEFAQKTPAADVMQLQEFGDMEALLQ